MSATAKGIHGPTAERLELAAKVARWRKQGWTHQAVADRLGISRSYASELAADPDGSRARRRKESYEGACIDCGASTSGSNGREAAPLLCVACANLDRTYWTREHVIASVVRWTKKHGHPPSAEDWRPADPTFPYPNASACYGFGAIGVREGWVTWNDFLRAAGLPTWSTGQHGSTPRSAA